MTFSFVNRLITGNPKLYNALEMKNVFFAKAQFKDLALIGVLNE